MCCPLLRKKGEAPVASRKAARLGSAARQMHRWTQRDVRDDGDTPRTDTGVAGLGVRRCPACVARPREANGWGPARCTPNAHWPGDCSPQARCCTCPNSSSPVRPTTMRAARVVSGRGKGCATSWPPIGATHFLTPRTRPQAAPEPTGRLALPLHGVSGARL